MTHPSTEYLRAGEPTGPRRLSPLRVLLIAGTLGLLAGLVETAIQVWRRFVSSQLWLFGPDLVWLAPLADLAIFLLFGLVYAGLMFAIRPLRRPSWALGFFSALAAFAVFSLFEGLHIASAGLLGLGIGSVVARTGWASSGRLGRLPAVLVGLVLILATGVRFALQLVEQRAVAGLGQPAPGRPNVLLLVLDTVRAWDLGFYGYPRATTPRLDRRFEGATVFDRVLATSSWTLPSHASMFTGRLPIRLSANWESPLGEEPPTLAEAMAAAGYATGGFVGNFRYTGRSTGLARGFVHYDDYPLSWDEALRMASLSRRLLKIGSVQEWLGTGRILEVKSASRVNRDFLEWVDRRGSRPFFAFLNYVDAHAPYLPPPPYDSMFAGARDPARTGAAYVAGVDRVFGAGPMPPELLTEYIDAYDGSIRYLDTEIDSLFRALDGRGVLANTVVVLTADHGEHFGEHRLIQHGNSLYLPLLHVPLVVWWPGHVPAGRVGAPASLRNLAATILDLAKVPNPGIPGRSLARWWSEDPEVDREPDTLVSAVDWYANQARFLPSPLLGGSLRSIQVDSLHLIRRADGFEELYDLSRDFLESRNLAGYPPYRTVLLDARQRLEAALGGAPAGPRPR